MPTKFSTALRTARATAIASKLDAGTTPAVIEFYTASQPTTGGAAITTQVLIGTCIMSANSGTVANGILTFNPIADDTAADASGIIAWARLSDGDGNFVMDIECGLTGSGAGIIVNQLSVQAGGLIKVVSGVITEGNA